MSGLSWTFIVIGLLAAFAGWACVAVGSEYERMCDRQEKEHKGEKQ